MSGKKIVITSDRTMMSTYNGGVILGFAAIMPESIVPGWALYRFFCPPVGARSEGSAVLASCGMRRMEAALIEDGFTPDDIMVAHPDYLDMVVGSDTRIVSITHDDPMGRVAYHEIERMVDRGAPHNRSEFIKLVRHPAILSHKPAVVVGGSGAWEIDGETADSLGISHVVVGEGEITGAGLFRDIIEGKENPRILKGCSVDAAKIPCAAGATICGIVEIGRGCGRGCSFCLPTTVEPRSRPLDDIIRDVNTNVRSGQRHILLHSEDVFRFKGHGVNVNREAVLELFRKVKGVAGVSDIDITHTALATAYHNQELVPQISEIAGIGSTQEYMSAWVGIETGSPKLIARHMAGKPKPAHPEDWQDIVRGAYGLFRDNSWVPIASLVLGLPGETEDDVMDTLELIHDLRDCQSMVFPLFFISMGGTRLSDNRSFTGDDCTPEHWMLIGECLEHNLRHMKSLFNLYTERMDADRLTIMAIKVFLSLLKFRVGKYVRRMKRGEPPK